MKQHATLVIALFAALLLPLSAHATNGDNLIGIGPISRAMGGVGIAAPQDAISATFANPAAMLVTPGCPKSEFDFAATLFAPKIDGKVTINPAGGFPAPGEYKNRADEKVYTVPAFGFSAPLSPDLRFGLSAYGITGLGVDHRDSKLSGGLLAADNTQLMILKVAPNLAYQVTEQLSVGAALHVVNSQLDLNQGSSTGYGVGAQLGALYRSGAMRYGLTYLSPISANHQNVYNLDEMTTGSATQDAFELEAPQQLGLGIAYGPGAHLLLETNIKWVNWSDAKGYDVLGWDDQIVVALGGQIKPTDRLILRLGYNYAKNQVGDRTFDGDGVVNVQGKPVNAYGFETLRVIGFPAIVEHHITAGLGYDVTRDVSINLGYMHAFKEKVRSTGTLPSAFGGNPVALESTLSENAVDFSIAWKF